MYPHSSGEDEKHTVPNVGTTDGGDVHSVLGSPVWAGRTGARTHTDCGYQALPRGFAG